MSIYKFEITLGAFNSRNSNNQSLKLSLIEEPIAHRTCSF